MILVIAEQREGALNRASWEPLVPAQQSGGPVKIVVIGSNARRIADELAVAAVAEVLALEHPALDPYTPDAFVQALAEVVRTEQPEFVFLPHTYQTRDFAPKLAARLGSPMVTDCVAVKQEGNGHVYVRALFQGKLNADVALQGALPHFVAFQVGAFRPDNVKQGAAAAAVRSVNVALDAVSIRQKPEPPFKEAKHVVDLSQAERIVAVGRGIKEQQHLALAERLARAIGAEIAASRPICDAGWLPMDRQIGSSGQTVAPKLYIALGISGAIQHVVGTKGSRSIVAINKDPE
ncbi:MAG: electron transfer flavoprotein subunit alpha/FixB family protein, partial [Acidobacteria bacterium]|nr:electron transfer flavoprotein subunit alpha/FixB family protein [Acidobacteriota bacterium]